MIRFEAFTKQFDGVAAVSGVDLDIRSGETVALVGPARSGKTTSLKAVLGLVRPTAGRVLLGGLDVGALGWSLRARIGYLPQQVAFPPGSTPREVMLLFARLRGTPAQAIEPLLERVGLLEAADRPMEPFPAGLSQRLGLAVALLGDPAVLVLDEPTASLDTAAALLLREIVAAMQAEGKTVLIASHELAEVASLACRVAVLVAGRIVAIATPEELAETLARRRCNMEALYREAARELQVA